MFTPHPPVLFSSVAARDVPRTGSRTHEARVRSGDRLVSNQFEFEENLYTILTSTVPFKLKNETEEINYVFPGYGPNQEHLLLQDVHITCIIDQYKDEFNLLRDQLANNNSLKNINHKENINLLHYFMTQTFTEVDNDACKKHTVALHQDTSITQHPLYPNATDNKCTRIVLPLSYWTERNSGVCRHINMLLFLLVGHAVANGFFSPGNVFAIQSEMFLHGDAHVVVGYQETNGNFWILDFVSHQKRVVNIGNIEHQAGIYDLMKCYGYDKSNMKGNLDAHYGAAFYVLDIMARYHLPINLSILFDEIEEEGLIDFFQLADTSMLNTYFNWIMDNVNKTSSEDIHTKRLFLAMQSILSDYMMLKTNDESKPENEQALKKLSKSVLSLHLITINYKLGNDMSNNAQPNRLTPPAYKTLI